MDRPDAQSCGCAAARQKKCRFASRFYGREMCPFVPLERPESLNLPACMCAEHADTLRMLHDLTMHPKVDKSEMDGGSFVLSVSNLSLMVDVNPTANNVTARLGLESTYSARVSAFMKEVVGRPSQELKVVGGGRGPKAFLDAVFVSRTEAFLDAKCVILDLWEAAEGAGEEAEGGFPVAGS